MGDGALTCPKCRTAAREEMTACPRCGLARARWESWDNTPPPHPLIDPLWEAARAEWQEERHHKALAAAVGGDLPGLSALAARYRGVLLDRPDDEVAARALQQVLRQASALPAPQRPPEPVAAKIVKGVIGAGLLLMSIYMLINILQRMR